jgi:RNA polymerase sigma-70 factor, ECF subfamily
LIPVAGERSDSELIELCRAGDAEAFGALFDRHRAEVTRLVFRMLGPSADLEDLVQEVFVQVIRSLGAFQGHAQFSTWLYRVTVNVVLMHRRALSRRPRLLPEEAAPPEKDPEPSPEEQVQSRLRLQAFYRALDQLSEKKRAVFVLHEIEGLTPAAISAIVRAPVLTVRTRLFYARRDLAKLLEQEPQLAGMLAERSRERAPASRVAEKPAAASAEPVAGSLGKGSVG